MSQALAWLESYCNPLYYPVCEVLNNLLRGLRDYTKEAVEHLIVATVIYIVLCVLLYVSVVRWQFLTFRRDVKSARRVLFVIAHPDDECMFFGPTILHFTQNSNCLVYLLCLSTGANYGMGKTRKNELYKSCKILGIDEGCIIIQNHSLLPDSMEVKWPVELVAQIILNQVEAYDIDTLITFDRDGVSKHLNHCSIYYAIAFLCIDHQLPEECKVYVLETINVIRKYWLILDLPLCYILSRNRYIVNCKDKKTVVAAMKQHRSQLLWFRSLYLLFSRYIIINTLQEMDISDIELDLEVND